MTVELSAVRLLAPWFGTSSSVWTNVIAVVLAALSLGYLAGARLSAGADPRARLGQCLIGAAAATAWLPAAAAPAASLFLPAGLALDEAAELIGWGSLAAACLLFLLPAGLLGCVAPLATEIVARSEGRAAGSAGGRVLAASTLGSIAGTFATTYVALPRLGLSTTFLVAGAALGALGALVWLGSRRAALRGGLAALALVLPALALSRLRPPPPRAGATLLAAGESAYQSVRVLETSSEAGPLRTLEVNEGFDSFQSVWQPAPGLLPPGYYYNLFALPPWWEGGGGRWRVLVVGLGAGTAWRVLEGSLPPGRALAAEGVELDPLVVAYGRRWMDLADERADRLALAGWDGRAALRALDGAYDQILVDAYANQVEIPAHLSTREFFAELRGRLRPGGWLCANVGSFGLDDPVVLALGATVASAFERRVLAVRVPFSRNCVLFVRRDDDPPVPADARWTTEGPLEDLQRRLAVPGATRSIGPDDARVLLDDRNEIEELQRRSIAEGRRRRTGGS